MARGTTMPVAGSDHRGQLHGPATRTPAVSGSPTGAWAIGVVAGISVRDYNSAAQWYQQLFGSEPAFYANDIETVWMMAEDRYVYFVGAPDRVPAVRGTWFGSSTAREFERIAERGLPPADIEIHADADADGYETGIGGNWVEPG